jgi:hypothetical protein
MNASRAFRLAAVGALVLVSAIAIGAASRPHLPDISFSTPQPGEVAVLALLVLAAGIGLLVGSNRIPIFGPLLADVPPQGKKSRIPWELRLVMVLSPFMVLAFVLASTGRFADGGQRSGPLRAPALDASGWAAVAGDGNIVLACIAVGVVSALVAAALLRTRKPTRLVQNAQQESIAAIMDEGLDTLLAEHDPRKAVIAAYVAMERAMARRGWARRAHEAPTEYLSRVLEVAPSSSAALDNLVGLYEYARFSEHAVTPAMRDDAVDTVRRLRAELAEPA